MSTERVESSPRRSFLLGLTLRLALYTAATLLLLSSLLPVFTSALPGDPRDPDTAVGLWFPWHVARRLLALQNPFLAPELAFPDGLDLTLMVWNLGCQILQFPFFALLDPTVAFNVTVLFFSVLNALAFEALGRQESGSREAGIFVGLLGLLAPFPLFELCNGRPEQGFVAPLTLALLYLLRVLRGGCSPRDVRLLGLFTGLSGICYWFWPYLLALVALPLLLVALARADHAEKPRLIKNILKAAALAVLVALPFALPVLLKLARPDSLYERALEGSFATQAAEATRLGQAIPLPAWFWPLLPPRWRTLNMAFPLTLTLGALLSLAPRASRRKAWPFLVLAFIGAICAMGPLLCVRPGIPFEIAGRQLALPFAALDLLPGFPRFWWPRRFEAFLILGVIGAISALLGAARAGWPRRSLGVVLLLLAGLEVFHLGQQGMVALGGGRTHALFVPELYRELGKEPWSQPVLRLPLFIPSNNDIVGQTFHRQALFGGLAQSNPDLAAPALRARLQEPCVQALHRATCVGIEGDDTDCPDARAALLSLGIRQVIWRREGEPGGGLSFEGNGGPVYWGTGRLVDLLGEPTWSEEGLLAWKL